MNFYGTDAGDFNDNQANHFTAMYGGDGDDFLGLYAEGNGQTNYIDGGRGSDFLLFRDLSYGELSGGPGGDKLVSNVGADHLYGGEGDDDLSSDGGEDELYGGGGIDALYAGDGDDRLYGGSGSDTNVKIVPLPYVPNGTIAGLYGGGGNDKLYGEDGNDFLDGGPGRDVMFGGGGADTFYFNAVAAIAKDAIRDFSHEENDLISLRDLDARDHKPGNQKFTFIGAMDFSGTKGELQFRDGKLKGDTTGDQQADFTIKLDVDKLTASDFLL